MRLGPWIKLIKYSRKIVAAKIAKRLCPGLTGAALGAIADFAYNLGPTRLAASTLRKRLNEGDMQGAREEIVKWVHAGGRILPGLVKRRRMEANFLRQ